MSEKENNVIKECTMLEEDQGVAQQNTDVTKTATTINAKLGFLQQE